MSEKSRDITSDPDEVLSINPERDKRRDLLRLFVILLILIVLIFLFQILTEFGSPFFITILVLLFVFLVFLGLLLRKNSGSIYKKLFPDKRDAIRRRRERRERKIVFEKTPEIAQHDKVKNVDLNVKYKKPMIKRCPKCNMIVPNFMKKCPNCGQEIV